MCKANFDILYRVQLDSTKFWVFVCKDCLTHEKSKNKHYRYGGTWKKYPN